MKFSIGYQLPDEFDSITNIAQDFKEHIDEVYFAWPGDSSGRSPLGIYEGGVTKPLMEVFEEELSILSEMGIKLVLLFNANCYGGEAISKALEERVLGRIDYLSSKYKLSAVTTTSPFIAQRIKEKFPSLEVRASVNMRIGTIKGMEQLSDRFDGFYLQREYNREPSRITQLKEWCDDNGKKLHMLANSGCLNFCPSQTYHDNLVAHEAEIVQKDNVYQKYPSPCWDFMSKRENWVNFLQNSWVRPEDINNYDKWFSSVKLATRMHGNPRKVISAYSKRSFRGNLLDLTEPGYGSIFNNYIIDNTRFPEDWFQKTRTCDKICSKCSYCGTVLEKVLGRVY